MSGKVEVRRLRVLYGAIGLVSLAATELGRTYYRPYIRANALNDWHVADTLGNSFGTLTVVFVALAIFARGTEEDRKFLFIAPTANFLYELGHPLLGRPIDPWDMVATVLAGLLSAGIYALLPWRPTQDVATRSA